MTMGVPLIVSMIPLTMMGIWLEREYFEGIRRFKENEQFIQQQQQQQQQTPVQTPTKTRRNTDGENERVGVALEEESNDLEQIGLTETVIEISNETSNSMNVNLCSWKILAGVGFGGSVISDQKEWRMDLDLDNNRNIYLVYRNKINKTTQKEKPRAIQLIEAGVKASTLMHLTHNLLAIVFSIFTYIVVFTFNLDVDPSKF